MFETSLLVKSIAKLLDKNGKPYYQLVLNELASAETGPPYNALFVYPEDKERKITVFRNSGYVQVIYFVDIDADDPATGQPGVKQPINLSENFDDIEAAYVVVEKVHLYAALEAGNIYEGFWICGEIVTKRVEPYTLNGNTVKYYTLPMLWDELHLTDEQKESRTAREFAWKGRPLAQGTAKEWAEEDEEERRDKYYESPWSHVTNADAFDDPSDYWNID